MNGKEFSMLELAKNFELAKEKYIDLIKNTLEMEKYARWLCSHRGKTGLMGGNK